MMDVHVNGELRAVEDGLTVLALVQSLGARADGRGVAVAIGGEVVPRSAWSDTQLADGVHVEVLTAVQGG
jgi:sulfur carrier protein